VAFTASQMNLNLYLRKVICTFIYLHQVWCYWGCVVAGYS